MRKAKPTIIGSKTVVDFPELGVQKIPAKVDTGADSSSVWASDIREEDGVLHYRLFDRESPFFDGKEITTKSFKSQMVKNSFGHTEFRYKVPLKVTIEGRTVNARITLSNRSQNRYPILIGRRTLKSKFLVDVAREHDSEATLRVLVLAHVGTKKARAHFDELNESLQGRADIEIARYDELMAIADNSDTTIRVKTTGRDLKSYGFIFFFTRKRDVTMAAMVAAYAKRHGIGFSDQAAALLSANAKAHQAVLLSGRGVNVPKTVYMDRSRWGGSYDELVELLGTPFVFKDDKGLKGRNNYLISSKKEFDLALKAAIRDNLQMVAQTFIPNDGYYRMVVMGRELVLAMYRPVDTSVSHTYSKKRDGDAQLIKPKELPSAVQQMAISAAQMLSLEVAGVDILQDNQTGEWYCLEVNNSPQLVGGAFVEHKMQALGSFFLQESKK